MQNKYCSKCQQWKPVTEFYKSNRGGCKKCVRDYQERYYQKHYAKPPKPKLPDGTKKCSKCHQVKSITEFYQDKGSKTGYQHKCKLCSDEARRIRKQKERQRNPKERLPEGLKKCNKCKSILPLSEFRLTPKGGYTSPCKSCQREYRQQNRDRFRELENTRRKNLSLDQREARRRRWREKPETQAKEDVYNKNYRRRDYVKDKNKARNIEYRSHPENQEKARQKTIAWRKANQEKARHQAKIKAYRKKGAEGSHTLDQWLTLLSYFDCCPKCREDRILTRDHIIPLTAGGTNYIDNIQPLCRSCNSKKLNTTIIDYRPREVREWAHNQVSV